MTIEDYEPDETELELDDEDAYDMDAEVLCRDCGLIVELDEDYECPECGAEYIDVDRIGATV